MAFQAARLCLKTAIKTSSIVYCRESSCQYSRWSHRRPSKVLQPFNNPSLKEESIVDLSNVFEPKVNKIKNDNSNKLKKKSIEVNDKIVDNNSKSELFNLEEIDAITKNEAPKFKRKVKKDMSDIKPPISYNVFDENGDFIYEKLPNKDANMSNLILKLKSRKERGKCGNILVEGWRLIADGLQAGCELEKLIFSKKSDLEKLQPYMPQQGPKIYKMPYTEIQMWSNLDTSPGITGIFKTPKLPNLVNHKSFPIQIICDNIREPGNLGAILRAALGAGCQDVLLTKGCVDLWNSKVLRSAAGAHFRLPIQTELTWEKISDSIGDNSSIFIADSNGNIDHMKKPIIIQKKVKNIRPAYNFTDRSKLRDVLLDDGEDQNEEPIATIPESDLSFPVLPYYGVDYSGMESITLIVGGETEGISEECYKFGHERLGARLHIPLTSGVDSLNSGTALAIIAFEIKRQLVKSTFKPNVASQEASQVAVKI